MRNKKVLFAVLTGIVLALTGCGPEDTGTGTEENTETGTEENTATGTEENTETGTENSEETDPAEMGENTDSYVSSPEDRAGYVKTWISTENGEQELFYKLTLMEDGMAQLVVQDGIGDLYDLYGGEWSLKAPDELYLDFIREETQEVCEGTYHAAFGDFNTLCLTPGLNAAALTPAMETGTAVFYMETAMDSYAAYSEEEICSAALGYYNAYYFRDYGEEYPGTAQIDSVEETFVTVHIFEDTGEENIATAAWYSIDPVTLTGTNEVTGEEIDFSPYLP